MSRKSQTIDPAQIYRRKFGTLPGRILMLKGHSAGVGDILRSSAAWRSLRAAFPEAELHLVMLTTDPGSASESLIARHHLLQSFYAIDKRTKTFADWRTMLRQLRAAADRIQPDLIIDFEPHGLKSSIATWLLRWRLGAATLGVAQIPGRGFFYRMASESMASFAARRGLQLPMEYTHRDFVCLAALGIERNGRAIELQETAEAIAFRNSLRQRFGIPPEAAIIGLNIGCGTPDAVAKRPELKLIQRLFEAVQDDRPAVCLLTGATYERGVNREFLALLPPERRALTRDLAGQTTVLELAGVIRSCGLFISTDSGPYHMAVALKAPTLAIFRWPHPVHYHHADHVRCVTLGKEEHVGAAALAAVELLRGRFQTAYS